MSIDKRPNGRYRARVREYPGGPERTRHFVRKVDAERWVAEMRVQLARGTYLTADQQRVTLAQYVDVYMGRQVWRERTREVVIRGVGRAIDYFGAERPLTSIRRGDVEAFVVDLSTKMATSTAKVMFQHFRSLIRSAMADGLLVVDPTLRIRLPETPSSDLVVPDAAQVRALLDAAAPDFAAAIILGAHVGLRAGEVQGLRVSDVDFLRRTVNVRQQFDGRTGRMAAGELKTRSSFRSVPVPAMVTEALAEHVRQYPTGPSGALVHHDGEHMSDNRFYWRWRKAQTGAGLDAGSLRFHWLRHSFASSLISSGCSVKAVADAMGHSDPTITLRRYASLWPGDDDRIRQAIEQAWTETIADSLRTAAGQS